MRTIEMGTWNAQQKGDAKYLADDRNADKMKNNVAKSSSLAQHCGHEFLYPSRRRMGHGHGDPP